MRVAVHLPPFQLVWYDPFCNRLGQDRISFPTLLAFLARFLLILRCTFFFSSLSISFLLLLPHLPTHLLHFSLPATSIYTLSFSRKKFIRISLSSNKLQPTHIFFPTIHQNDTNAPLACIFPFPSFTRLHPLRALLRPTLFLLAFRLHPCHCHHPYRLHPAPSHVSHFMFLVPALGAVRVYFFDGAAGKDICDDGGVRVVYAGGGTFSDGLRGG